MQVIARIEKYLSHGEHYDGLEKDLAILVARARLAYTDPLTGVANRAGLVAEWPELCLSGPTVVMIDLDRFKPINDEHGHAAGDLILVEVAVRLGTCGGRVARLGGDEFALVLPQCALVRAVALMNDLCRYVARPIWVAGVEMAVTMSVGMYRATSLTDLGLVLACADAAMYRAKATGIAVAAYNPHVDGRPVVDGRPIVRLRDRWPSVT